MKITNATFALLLGAGLALGGCTDDPMTNEDESTGADETGTTTGTTDTGPNPTTATTTTMTTLDTTDTEDPTETEGTTTTGMETDTDTDTGEDEFVFDDSPPEDYAQVDRMGMPAINSAVITDKDVYNMSSPADDASGMFVDQIITNVTGLHDALDDDLIGAMLVPCAPMDCVNQAAPLVVPDTLKIDLTVDAGFPNGRLPADPVMDVTLAVVLLDLSAMGQTALTLVGLNPTANDVEFSEDFPYFAPPHM